MQKALVHSLICSASLCLPTALFGAVVSVCDEPSLRAAIASGGTAVFACDGTITLSNTISIHADVFLDGNGRNVTISGGNAVRLFDVSPGVTFALRNLSLSRGFARGTNGAPNQNGGPGQGGAIYNEGTVLATECRFLENMALGGSGGIGLGGPPPPNPATTAGSGGAGQGGAIFNQIGQVHATNCVFAGNRALGGVGNSNTVYSQIVGMGAAGRGGAVGTLGGTVLLKSCSFSNNVATASTNGMPRGQPGGWAFGGAIYVDGGIVRATDISFLSNVSQGSEGASGGNFFPPGAGGSGFGGTAYTTNGQFLATNCTVAFSTALGGKAGVGQGTFPLGFGGNAAGGAFYCAGGVVEFVDSVIARSTAVSGFSTRFGVTVYDSGVAWGGAIYNDGADVHIRGTEVLNNSAASRIAHPSSGGAVYQARGALSVATSVFATNSAVGGNGAPTGGTTQFRPGGPGQGGALFIASGVADLNACAFIGNTSAGGRQTGPGSGADGQGGAIYNAASITVTNCTITASASVGSSAINIVAGFYQGGGGYGGGIYNAGGTSVLSYVTIATNATSAGGGGTNTVENGGGIYSAAGMTDLYASILACNSPSNCFGNAFTDGGFNISSDGSCPFSATGSRINLDPRLGPVGDYGGNTLTMALLAGSPAMDAATGAVCPSTDQRGRARPFGSACDIGAFESSPPYTISGRITGHFIAPGIGVSAGAQTAFTDATLAYRLHNLTPGSHSVVPSTAAHLIIPSSRNISVGPDILGVDFTAYRWNSLNADPIGGGTLRLRYAGTNSDVIRLQATSDLVNWLDRATNTVGPDGLTDFLQPTSGNRQFFRTVKP